MLYDVLIIGGGPGGLTAAIYAVRAGLSALVFEPGLCGGQAATTHWIDNYPGFAEGISGEALGNAMEQQATKLGVLFNRSMVKSVDLRRPVKKVNTRKEEFEGKTVIIATGSTPRKLEIESEERFVGAGVSYCATCDGGFFKNKTVAVIGGGDTALGDAAYLSKIANKVYLIHRRDAFRAAKLTQDAALAQSNVQVLYSSVVAELEGEGKLSALNVQNLNSGEITRLEVDGAFVAVGSTPQTTLFVDQVDLQGGFIETNAQCETNVAGVYAVGDVRDQAFRQIVTACADGAIAAETALKYLQSFA